MIQVPQVDALEAREKLPAPTPLRRLATAVLRQSLADAAAGQGVYVPGLDRWAYLAGIPAERIRDIFARLTAGDPATSHAVKAMLSIYWRPIQR